MSSTSARGTDPTETDTDALLDAARGAGGACHQYLERMREALPLEKGPDNQFVRHGFAWIATLTEALDAVVGWASQLHEQGAIGRLEQTLLGAVMAEYFDQIIHGVAMSQDEIFRPHHLGLEDAARALSAHSDVISSKNLGVNRTGGLIIEEVLRRNDFGAQGLDETLSMIAGQFRSFADEKIVPHAHDWHRKNQLIPQSIVDELGALGVFGLTIGENHGGSGMGKLAMCVVTEELSRGYIGVGSLGTRSEIAGELIQIAGTPAQRQKYLPGIASGAILPAAVFTEPDTGSDLAALTTRAVRQSDGDWSLTGSKTWITHAARSDLMTVLARSRPQEPGYRGLTMFLLDKTRGSDEEPFPDPGISGSEIEVLGYRGMKEYAIAFDNVRLPTDATLGGAEGEGFKQLMSTFEGARIQTAARSVGVAVNACELALQYAQERIQFGEPLLRFQRVYGKIARMVVDITAARQLTYRAARRKDGGRRCDIEAGMAKLLAARTAWSCADNALQIHGGNGYAVEYPISRVMNDARILNIFEGAAEIQADVVARGLLSRNA